MRYFKAKKVTTEHTTLSFSSSDPGDKILHYAEIGGYEYLGVESTDADILAKQLPEIEAVELTFAEIKPILNDSRMMEEYNKIIDRKIAEKYSLQKEIGLIKLAEDNPTRVTYQQYVDECKAQVRPMKIAMGLVE